MTEADVQRLLANDKIRRLAPDPETARKALEHVSVIVEATADDL